MELPDSFLGLVASYGEKPDLSAYPVFYQLQNDVSSGLVGGTPCLFIMPKEAVRLPMLLKMVAHLQSELGKPCVIVSQNLSRYQIGRLTEENVAWVASESAFSCHS